MSDTNRTEAPGYAAVCVHDAASVSPQEGSWEGPQGKQTEVTQSRETEKTPPEATVPEVTGSDFDLHDKSQFVDKCESGLGKDDSESEESKFIETDNPDGCVQFDISCELGGVSTEIKTAFKDVQSELLSAVSEVKSDMSHVLHSSTQFCLGAADQDNTISVDNGNPEDSVMLMKNESEESEHVSNVGDIVVQKYSNRESHLEKDDLPVFESEAQYVKVVTDPLRYEHDRSDSNSGRAAESVKHGEAASCEVAMDTRAESSEEKDEVFVPFSLHEELSRNIAIEVTEDFLKEKVDCKNTDKPRKESRFEVNRVFSVQSRLTEECECDKEECSSHLCHSSNEHAQKAQPLSAPSTPVPSASTTARKSLRSQACRGRRVSFPEDETHLISSYLEPVNPWQQMGVTTVEEIAAAYRTSCDRHRTQPLPGVLQQIKALPLVLGGRVECLSLRAQRLDSSQCEGLEEIFRRVQFKILDLEGCCLDDDTAIPLFDMIEFYDSATQLNISCNDKIGFRGWQACSRMLKRTPSVEYLDARSTNLNETNMPILGRALRLGSRLHTLHLESCNLTGRPLIILTAALRQNETLTELYLADNRLGVNDCIQLSNLVRANSTLLLLDLRNNNVQDAGCSHVCEGITEQQKHQQQQQQQGEESEEKTRCRGLRSLVLWNNHLTPQSAPHLANMLATTRALETLNLGRNNLTSEGILRLKESLLRNHALLRLGLQAARIADEGAVALAEYTADNRVIQHVDLRDNPIRVAGLLALAHSLRLNSTVIQMDIDSDARSEPSAELAEQHFSLQKEIKEICQRNLTQSHLKAASQMKTETPESASSKPAKEGDLQVGVIRKTSLSCETTLSSSHEFHTTEVVTREEEKQKYVSPAPSPIPSPCPSPCPSPSPSPVPSPLRNNRFRVFKVAESSKSSPDLIASTSQPTVVYSAVHVSQAGRSLSAGDLSQPPKQSGVRPNRFGIGGRFTVTRVVEPCSLPSTQVASVLASSYTNTGSAPGPKIVISSPVRVERGFSVDETSSKEAAEKSGEKQGKCDESVAVDFKAAKLPENATQCGQARCQSDSDVIQSANHKKCLSESQRPEMISQRSLTVFKNNTEGQKSDKDCDSPSWSELTDSGFLDEGSCRSSSSVSPSPSPSSPRSVLEGDRDSLLSSSVDSTNQEDTGLGLPLEESEPLIPVSPCNMQQFDIHSLHEPPKRAPLAAMENGSFDSDSEDSELMTQSSDSTHSDEVRITTEQFEPRQAWGSKPEQPQVTVASETVVAPEVTESG